jgi:hypothetical protein
VSFDPTGHFLVAHSTIEDVFFFDINTRFCLLGKITALGPINSAVWDSEEVEVNTMMDAESIPVNFTLNYIYM